MPASRIGSSLSPTCQRLFPDLRFFGFCPLLSYATFLSPLIGAGLRPIVLVLPMLISSTRAITPIRISHVLPSTIRVITHICFFYGGLYTPIHAARSANASTSPTCAMACTASHPRSRHALSRRLPSARAPCVMHAHSPFHPALMSCLSPFPPFGSCQLMACRHRSIYDTRDHGAHH